MVSNDTNRVLYIAALCDAAQISHSFFHYLMYS